MKRLFKIYCIVILISQSGYTQNQFSLGISTSTHIDFIEITNSKAVDFIDETVNSKVAYGFGFQLQYSFKNTLFVRSGFNYQSFKYEHNIVGILDEGNPWNDQAWNTTKEITSRNIRIPLEIGYNVLSASETVMYYVGASGAIHLNLENKSTGTFFQSGMSDVELNNTYDEISGSKYSIGLFTGVEFKILETTSVDIEPYIRYNPNKFMLYLFDTEASARRELGLTIRLRML